MKFTKMHGAGNDYIYFDARDLSQDWPEVARKISDRHFGVGSDGLILILDSGVADLKMRMFNADGSEGEMCGNGIRCFAKYAIERGIVSKSAQSLSVETLAGVRRVVPVFSGQQVVGGLVELFGGGFPGADVHVEVDLAAVGVDYLAVKLLSQGHCQPGFAHGRGADDKEDGWKHIGLGSDDDLGYCRSRSPADPRAKARISSHSLDKLAEPLNLGSRGLRLPGRRVDLLTMGVILLVFYKTLFNCLDLNQRPERRTKFLFSRNVPGIPKQGLLQFLSRKG